MYSGICSCIVYIHQSISVLRSSSNVCLHSTIRKDDLFCGTFIFRLVFESILQKWVIFGEKSQNVMKVKHGDEHMLWFQDLWSVASLEQCPRLVSNHRSTSFYASRKCSLQTGRVAHTVARFILMSDLRVRVPGR